MLMEGIEMFLEEKTNCGWDRQENLTIGTFSVYKNGQPCS